MLAEMIDAATAPSSGNLPQALSHLALVNAAITIDSLTRAAAERSSSDTGASADSGSGSGSDELGA